MRGRWAAAVCLALVVAACTGAEPPKEEPIPPPGHGNAPTCRFHHARPRRGEIPTAVDALGRDDVWVVGARYVGGTATPYASNWDGRRWDSAPVELVADTNAGFHDIALVSRGDAWAVGWLRAEAPMVQRWDGSAWTAVEVPAVGTTELFGVSAASDDAVWAAGRALDGRRWTTWVLRWDGVSWRTQDTPSPADANATLRGIDAAGPGDVWAVGWTVAAGGRHRTLAMHSDGSRWRVVPTPNPGPGDHVLSSVAAVGPAEAWAVGWTIPRPDRERASILRWDGHGWRPSPLPYIAGRAQLTDVAAVGPDDVWAVGRATDRTQTFRSLVLHWDGSAWERVEAPSVGIEDDTLAGVAVANRSPWGVGTAVDQGGIYSSLVLHGC